MTNIDIEALKLKIFYRLSEDQIASIHWWVLSLERPMVQRTECRYGINYRDSVVLSDVFEIKVHNTVRLKGGKNTFSISIIFFNNKQTLWVCWCFVLNNQENTNCMLGACLVENRIWITWYLLSWLPIKYTIEMPNGYRTA